MSYFNNLLAHDVWQLADFASTKLSSSYFDARAARSHFSSAWKDSRHRWDWRQGFQGLNWQNQFHRLFDDWFWRKRNVSVSHALNVYWPRIGWSYQSNMSLDTSLSACSAVSRQEQNLKSLKCDQDWPNQFRMAWWKLKSCAVSRCCESVSVNLAPSAQSRSQWCCESVKAVLGSGKAVSKCMMSVTRCWESVVSDKMLGKR